MGNEQSTDDVDSHQSRDYIADLRHHFRSHMHVSDDIQPNQGFKTIKTKKQKSKKYKSHLPKCPICLTEVKTYRRLKNCNHFICYNCLNQYILTNLKDISKYPLLCFQSNCKKLLDFGDIEYGLNHDKTSIFIFDKFSILCAISPKEREQCPQCEMVFFYQSKWLREKTKPFRWIQDNERSHCCNDQCNKKFFGLIVRKHHCRICGDIFCDLCSSHLLSLSAASDVMLKTWIQSNNSHNKHQKVKKFIQNIAVSSTSDALWSSSEEDDDSKDIEAASLQLSRSEEIRIEEERVRCCYECWLDYYRGVCADCGYIYCIQCRQSWHDGYNCDDIKKQEKEIYLTNKLNEARTEELMLREGWRRCAGCKVWVAKIEGCNHMTHEKCAYPNEMDGKKCHFCYCCGDLLYDPHHKHEKDGTLHFEHGVFEDCRKNKKARKIREKLHDDCKSNIEQIEEEFNENGLVPQDKGCSLQ